MFEKIDELYEKYKKLPHLKPASLQRLMNEFLISYTYNSNAIEGNKITERETYLILKDDVTIPDKSLRNHLEVIGHRDAFLLIQKRSAMQIPISESLIKDIHSSVLIDIADAKGMYRDVDVHISGTDVVLASAETIPDRMAQLLNSLQTEMRDWHIVQRISKFHLLFETIHPFLDGNGRTGRLLLNYDLLLNGYPPIDIKMTDRNRYYYCFHAYQNDDRNEYPMMQMVSEYLTTALSDRIRIMLKAHDLSR